MTSIKKKAFDRCVAIVLSLAMLLVFPIVSFADVFAGTADAANSTQAVQTEESAAAEGESTGTDQDQATEPAASADSEEAAETDTDSSASEQDSTASEEDSSAANESGDASGNEGSEVSYPRQTFEDSVNGTKINVVAPEGALPEGTTMEVKAVASSDVKDEVEKAAISDIKDMQAIDISFHKDGKEIEPKSEVTVQFSGMDMDGDSIEVFHMKDTTSAADKVAESKSTTNASVTTDQFSIYIVAGMISIKTDNTAGKYSYVMNIGDTLTLKGYNYQKNYSTWTSDDSSIVSITSDNNKGTIKIEAKKMGAAVVSYTYYGWSETDQKYEDISDDYYITVKSADNKYQVCFYILLPDKTHPAGSSAQPTENYYPNHSKDSVPYYSLTGTITEATYNIIKGDSKTAGVPYYSANGLDNKDNKLFTMDASTKTAINTYLAANDTKYHAADGQTLDVAWYTLKQEYDKYPHIDGYVKNAVVPITYHSNYGNDATKADSVTTGGSYTVKTYTETELPGRDGYDFIGWSLNPKATTPDTGYAVADKKMPTINPVMTEMDYYAVWAEKATYNATYSFASGTSDMTLPTAIDSYLPKDSTKYNDGDVVTAKTPSQTKYDVVENGITKGTWTFQGWDNASKKVDGNDVSFVGTWTYTAAQQYTPTYTFTSGTANMKLPDEINNYLPNDNSKYYEGQYATPVAPTATTYDVVDNGVTTGTWTFQSWDSNSKQVKDGKVSFEGTWTYTAAEKYGVTYAYQKASDETRTLPTAISDPKTPGDYAVSDSNSYLVNQIVTRNNPKESTYEERENGVLIGTWSLSWPADSAAMVKGGLAFTGTWSFTKADTYTAEYKFEAASDAALEVLPKGVTDQCPATTTGLTNGKTITPVTGFSDVNQTDTDGNIIGTWTFKEWSPLKDTVSNANLSFTGYWSYTAVKPFHVTYEFKSNDGSTLPNGVKAQLPTDSKDYYVNNKVTAPTGFNNVPVRDKDGYIDGYWTFVSWDKADATFTDSDITFTGTWQYEKTNIEYRVMYKDINDPTGPAISTEEYGAGNNGDVVNYDYLNGKNQIKAITDYEYVKVEPVTLHGKSIALMARMASLFATDESAGIPTAIVYYRKAVTPPPASDKYTLTINYVDEQGSTLADSYTDSLGSGTAYSQASPVISGYELVDSTQATIAGTMPNENVTVTVVYKKTAVTPNDPNKPNDPTTPTTPGTVTPASDKSSDTGDSWNGGLWMILMLLGTAGVITPIALRKKDPEED